MIRRRGYTLPDPHPAEERRTAHLPLGGVPAGPPRKYYSLTEKGLQYLRSLDEAWDELVGQIQVIRHGRPDTAGQSAETPAAEEPAAETSAEPVSDPVPAFENPNM